MVFKLLWLILPQIGSHFNNLLINKKQNVLLLGHHHFSHGGSGSPLESLRKQSSLSGVFQFNILAEMWNINVVRIAPPAHPLFFLRSLKNRRGKSYFSFEWITLDAYPTRVSNSRLWDTTFFCVTWSIYLHRSQLSNYTKYTTLLEKFY